MTEHPAWPALPYEAWADTCTTLHLWAQILGKVRVARTPWENHSWHVPLYVTSRGHTTSPIPVGHGSVQLDLDFLGHRVSVATSRGAAAEFALEPMPVADFYGRVMDALESVGAPTKIHSRPNEVESPIPFAEDREHASYDSVAAERFFRALTTIDGVFKRFRARFLGKCSPVHFFWGSFDHAVTRFSGRTAPEHPGGIPNLPDWITREAYSHEVSSAGFWPGGAAFPAPIFYSYAYPTPEGFSDRPVRPDAATWNADLGEFVLEYEAVRTAPDPDATLMAFLEDTYEAAAECAGWDRERLEWDSRTVPEAYRPE
jgi:hypothetical protein